MTLFVGYLWPPAADRIEAVRQELARANISSGQLTQVQCLELLGEGTYGKVGPQRLPLAAAAFVLARNR